MEDVKFSDLIGKTVVKILIRCDEINIYTDKGEHYRMNHDQDCCESVEVEDIIGDVSDLLGCPILKASEDTSRQNPNGITKECQDSFTWTFYNIATEKGHITIRWYGESNGYYSESVSFNKIA
jgi:hypothetical protein